MMPQGVPVEQVGVLASSVGFDAQATAQGSGEEASTEEVTLTVSMVEEEEEQGERGEASAPRWQN